MRSDLDNLVKKQTDLIFDLECHERYMKIKKYLLYGITDLYRNEKDEKMFKLWENELDNAKNYLCSLLDKQISRKRSKNGV